MSVPVAIVAIADTSFRERVGRTLRNLHWQVLEAAGGAEALSQLEAGASTVVIVDTWLPDLEIDEFVREIATSFPDVELISTDGSFKKRAGEKRTGKTAGSRSGRRGELLYALRVSQEWDGAAFKAAGRPAAATKALPGPGSACLPVFRRPADDTGLHVTAPPSAPEEAAPPAMKAMVPAVQDALPEFHGTHPRLLEVCRRIRLVALRDTPVLVQGPSGSGKELVARALHRLSPRSARPLVVLNCAAIPEGLLEAELFGHTKGAFTGALQRRSGRIEAANGGTLFLDEVGEMPLPLQAKLLRFLEAGELQRVGDNDIVKVDVRVVAASHQPLARQAGQGLFRMDLFFRLAVFLIETPALETHMDDLPCLAQIFLQRLTANSPSKLLTPSAIERLHQHSWPGNIRELAHVIERAYILAENRREITAEEIEFVSFS